MELCERVTAIEFPKLNDVDNISVFSVDAPSLDFPLVTTLEHLGLDSGSTCTFPNFPQLTEVERLLNFSAPIFLEGAFPALTTISETLRWEDPTTLQAE